MNLDLTDASTQLAVAAAVMALLASLAVMADRRRARRANLDRAGFMPWAGIFFWCVLLAASLAGLAIQAWSSR